MATEGHSALDRAGLRFQIGIFEEALRTNPDDTEILRFLAHAYNAVGRGAEGLDMDRRIVGLLPHDARARYNLACSCALAGLVDEAVDVLRIACDLGFDDLNLVRRDSDLDAIRQDARYREIEADLAKRHDGDK